MNSYETYSPSNLPSPTPLLGKEAPSRTATHLVLVVSSPRTRQLFRCPFFLMVGLCFIALRVTPVSSMDFGFIKLEAKLYKSVNSKGTKPANEIVARNQLGEQRQEILTWQKEQTKGYNIGTVAGKHPDYYKLDLPEHVDLGFITKTDAEGDEFETKRTKFFVHKKFITKTNPWDTTKILTRLDSIRAQAQELEKFCASVPATGKRNAKGSLRVRRKTTIQKPEIIQPTNDENASNLTAEQLSPAKEPTKHKREEPPTAGDIIERQRNERRKKMDLPPVRRRSTRSRSRKRSTSSSRASRGDSSRSRSRSSSRSAYPRSRSRSRSNSQLLKLERRMNKRLRSNPDIKRRDSNTNYESEKSNRVGRLTSRRLLRDVKYRRLVVMERLLEEIKAAQEKAGKG